MDHILTLCCFGGEPFVDFHVSTNVHTIDPTDWAAELVNIFWNESTWLNVSLPESSVPLDACELFNISFADAADQAFFDDRRAEFACRCPVSRSGKFCELTPSLAAPLVGQPSNSSSMILVVAAALLALFAVVFMMVRGCFCDCFGPIRQSSADVYDKPLDPEDARKCLQQYRAYKAREEVRDEVLVAPRPAASNEPCGVPYVASAPQLPLEELVLDKYRGSDDYNSEVTLEVSISEARQKDAPTRSNFTVILLKLDKHNKIIRRHEIQKSAFIYATYTYLYSETSTNTHILDCLESIDYESCLVGADAVIIRYNDLPHDVWRVSRIDVTVSVNDDPTDAIYEERRLRFEYAHVVYTPVGSTIQQRGTYQLGPLLTFFQAVADGTFEVGQVLKDYYPYEAIE